MDQMSIKYTNILHCKTLRKVPKFRFFGLKTNHLANLLRLRLGWASQISKQSFI
jgi:hypothetical protein